MKKRLVYSLVILCILAGIVVSCKADDSSYVNDEITEALIKIFDEGMYSVNSDLDRVDKDIIETEVKILQLQRLVDPASAWVEDQKEKIREEKKSGAFTRRVDKTWLSENFANEQYAITDLSISIENIGSPTENSYFTIEVTDVTTKSKSDWNAIQQTLEERKASLEQNKQKIMAAGEKSIAALENAVNHIDDWQVSKVDSVTFLVRGTGLGSPEEGTWTYYKETGEIVPNDKASQALKRTLLGQ